MARPERQSANELAAGLRRVDEESKARGMGLKNSGEFGLVEDDRMKGRVRDRDSLPLSIHSRETARKRRPHEYYVKVGIALRCKADWPFRTWCQIREHMYKKCLKIARTLASFLSTETSFTPALKTS